MEPKTAVATRRRVSQSGLLELIESRPAAESAVATPASTLSVGEARERAARLAAAMTGIGVDRGAEVLLLCCERHAADFTVGLLATLSIGGTAQVVRANSKQDVVTIIKRTRARTVLACSDELPLWREAGRSGIVVVDGFGGYWWPVLERAYEPAPRISDIYPPGAVNCLSLVCDTVRATLVSSADLAELAQFSTGATEHSAPVGDRVRFGLAASRMWTGTHTADHQHEHRATGAA